MGKYIDINFIKKISIKRKILYFIAFLVILLGAIFYVGYRNGNGFVLYLSDRLNLPFASKIQTDAAKIRALASKGNATGQEIRAFKEAKPLIDKVLKENPKDLEVLTAVGYAYETSGVYDLAKVYYSEAVKLYPKDSSALFHYGHVLQFLGNHSEAEKTYREALKIDPNNASVLMALANIEAGKENLDKSAEMYIKASKIKNISSVIKAEALTGASVVRRMQIIHMKESISLASQAVKASPRFSPALSAYGFVLAINGNPNAGVFYLKKAISANPRISNNYNLLAQIYRANKLLDKAIYNQNVAIEKVDDDNTLLGDNVKKYSKARYYYDIAKTYYLARDNEKVISSLKEALKLNPLLKGSIEKDIEKTTFFKTIASEAEFKLLIK